MVIRVIANSIDDAHVGLLIRRVSFHPQKAQPQDGKPAITHGMVSDWVAGIRLNIDCLYYEHRL
jgi:hypothetical protein